MADLSPGGSKLLCQMGGQDARGRHCDCNMFAVGAQTQADKSWVCVLLVARVVVVVGGGGGSLVDKREDCVVLYVDVVLVLCMCGCVCSR